MDNATPQPPHWTFTQKQLLRLFALYFLIYLYSKHVFEFWDPVVLKAGQVLHTWKEVTEYPNGSGDTTYNYIQILCMLLLALTGSIIWWALDHKRRSYNTLLYWIMVLLRYSVAFYLLTYGFAKLYYSQLPFPQLRILVKTFGDATPMRLAWTFIGSSYPYNAFTGIAEIIGGCLLMFRRTTMFGCVFSMTVLANVVALNFCYDVPVKLFSSHLLLITIFICVPYMPRLWGFFLLHKDIPAMPRLSLYNTKRKRTAHLIIKTMVLVIIAWSFRNDSFSMDKVKPPLYGLYQTDVYVHNGDTLRPDLNDSTMWRYITIDKGQKGGIVMMNGKNTGYHCDVDTIEKTIRYTTEEDTIGVTLHYRLAGRYLNISYTSPGDTIAARLLYKDPADFKLIKTGFHMVNERPNN